MSAISFQQSIEAPTSLLERALITSYLVKKGYYPEALQTLPGDLVEKLLTEARTDASLKMAEIETRSQARRKILIED